MTSRLRRALRALALFMLLAVLLCAAVLAESAAGSALPMPRTTKADAYPR